MKKSFILSLIVGSVFSVSVGMKMDIDKDDEINEVQQFFNNVSNAEQRCDFSDEALGDKIGEFDDVQYQWVVQLGNECAIQFANIEDMPHLENQISCLSGKSWKRAIFEYQQSPHKIVNPCIIQFLEDFKSLYTRLNAANMVEKLCNLTSFRINDRIINVDNDPLSLAITWWLRKYKVVTEKQQAIDMLVKKIFEKRTAPVTNSWCWNEEETMLKINECV